MPSDATGSPRPDERSVLQPPATESISRVELRAVVREWTASLKEQGLPPERVLALVKLRVRETILPHVSRFADIDPDDPRHDRLLSDSSQWCIEALFEPADTKG